MLDVLTYSPHWDPYDLWSEPALGRAKARGMGLRVLAAAGAEALAPALTRKLLRVPTHEYAHVAALIGECRAAWSPEEASRLLALFERLRVPTPAYAAWGLPFPWYSKNGVYPAGTPFVTNTPYVMRSLIRLMEMPATAPAAAQLFHATWAFLGALPVMVGQAPLLALGYSPRPEPRVVVNANAYAVWGYAMHAAAGLPARRSEALDRIEGITRWIASQQGADGSWPYYADGEPGNFIDCFHSCFVVRNLRYAAALVPEIEPRLQPVISRGERFIRDAFVDSGTGLCRHYARPPRFEPYPWELYDQAEYLGLLLDAGDLAAAAAFDARVAARFQSGGAWFSRINAAGMRWGRNFLRWVLVRYIVV
jgi:hypothetical protein